MDRVRFSGGKLAGLIGMGALGALMVASCSSSSKSAKTTETTVKKGPVQHGLFPSKELNAAQQEGTPSKGGSISFGLEANIATLVPGVIQQPSDATVGLAVYDPIVGFDDSGKPAPTGLASGWTSSTDLKTWTFTLRPNITFTDGTPVDAAAVVTQIEAQKKLGNCVCAANYDHIVGVTAVSPLVAQFSLDQANVAFPTVISAGAGDLAAPASWAAGAATMTANPIGSGPFKLLSKGQLVFVRNSSYWRNGRNGTKLPYLDKITFVPLPSGTTRLGALHSGTVDIFQSADTSNLVSARQDPSLIVQPVTGSSSTIIVLNSHKPPFDDIRMRQAYNYALDREAINKGYYGNAREPAYGPLAPSHPYYDPKGVLPPYDPARAKQLVAAVKADGKSTSWTGICISTPEATTDFAIIKKLDEAVGMTSQLNTVDQATLVTKLLSLKGDFQQACFRTPQVGDPDDLYSTYYRTGGNNVSLLSNFTIDAALRAGRKSTTPSVRRRAYDTVQEELAREVVVVPLLFDLYGNVHTKAVSGLSVPLPTSLGLIDPGQLYRVAS